MKRDPNIMTIKRDPNVVTAEQLLELATQTVKQMSEEEKAKLRQQLWDSLRKDVK